MLVKTLIENLEASFGDLRQFDTKLFEPTTWADFQETKILEIATAKSARLYWTRKLAENQPPDLQDSKRQFEAQPVFEKTTPKI